MIGPIETIRDTANSWECDENDHINVQFYAARFDIAVRSFLVQAGWQVPHRAGRLIRYHAELRGGEPVHGTSALVTLKDGRVALEHRLFASHREGVPLAATGLDLLPDVERSDLSAFDLPEAGEDALPKTGALTLAAGVSEDALDACSVTYRGVVPNDAFLPAAESTDGARLSDRYLVGIVSDAATHAWALAGADDTWLRQRNWGRAAVQLQLTYGARPTAGDVVAIHTGLRAHSPRSVSYRHHIMNEMTDQLIAIADITSVMLNLDTRKSMPWPDDKKASVEASVTAFTKAMGEAAGS